MDNQGLEAGLSYIGLVLESAERRIAEFWAAYEDELEGLPARSPQGAQRQQGPGGGAEPGARLGQ